MAGNFRIIALIFLISPFAAMLSEPFFEALFDQLGLNTEDWVSPIMNILSDLSNLMYFALGLACVGIGAWLHYFAVRFDQRRGMITAMPKPFFLPLKLPKGGCLTKGRSKSLTSKSHDHALILRRKDPLKVEATKIKDGIDVVAKVSIRNRSRQVLDIGIDGKPDLILDEKQSEIPSGGLSLPFAKEAEQTSILGGMRFYRGVTGLLGMGSIAYKFGVSKEDLWILRIEIKFQIEGEPNGTGKPEVIPVSIIEIIEHYEPFKSEPPEPQ